VAGLACFKVLEDRGQGVARVLVLWAHGFNCSLVLLL
jgi:hypothetical protein